MWSDVGSAAGWRGMPDPARTGTAALDAACFSVYLHGNDRWLTEQMTTEEREAFADACDRHRATWPADDRGPLFDRWWRDSGTVGASG